VTANIALEVSLAANQTGMTASAWNTVKYDTKTTDVQNAYSTSTGLFTPTQAGLYAVSATVAVAGIAGSNEGVAIVKNGSIANAESQSSRWAGVASNNPTSMTALIFCNGTTDTVSVQVFLPATTTQALSSTNAGVAVNMVATLLQTGPVGPTGPAAGATATTFAGLPGSPSVGNRGFVTDATVSTFGSTVSAGGGTNKIPVFYNGTNWIVG